MGVVICARVSLDGKVLAGEESGREGCFASKGRNKDKEAWILECSEYESLNLLNLDYNVIKYQGEEGLQSATLKREEDRGILYCMGGSFTAGTLIKMGVVTELHLIVESQILLGGRGEAGWCLPGEVFPHLLSSQVFQLKKFEKIGGGSIELIYLREEKEAVLYGTS